MRVFITADMHWTSKIDHVFKVLDLGPIFACRDYGPGVTAVSVVIMCRGRKFHQRIRFQKATREFSMDVMLELARIIPMSHEERRSAVATALISEIPARLRKYKFADFDYPQFEADWTEAITDQLLGPEAARFDHLCKPQATFSGRIEELE